MDMSMHDYLQTKRRGLSEYRARNYLFQILTGLEHLHNNGLFHRDVKPENILIKFPSILYTPLSEAESSEIVKLADLGSVRGIFSEPPYTEYISTRWYRSPECLLTMGNYGPKMDIWAVGCVYYEMLTLKPLFPGNNEIDQLCKIHQVLGAPSLHYLSKLKSRSRNCVFFPKVKGTGIDIMLPYITRNGRHILRLMLEYDSEKRATVKRILKNCYFDEIRSSGKKEVHISESIRKGRGDDGSLSIYPMVSKYFKQKVYPDTLRKSSESTPIKMKLKRERDIARKDSKGSGKSCKSYKSSISNKSSNMKASTLPTLEIPYTSIDLKIPSLPIVNFKVQNCMKNKLHDTKHSKDVKREIPKYKKTKRSDSVEIKPNREQGSIFHSNSFACPKPKPFVRQKVQ